MLPPEVVQTFSDSLSTGVLAQKTTGGTHLFGDIRHGVGRGDEMGGAFRMQHREVIVVVAGCESSLGWDAGDTTHLLQGRALVVPAVAEPGIDVVDHDVQVGEGGLQLEDVVGDLVGLLRRAGNEAKGRPVILID